MELKLNVYKGREIEKTYTAKDFKLYTRDVEDVLNLINIESFTKGTNDAEATNEIIKMVVKGFTKFKPIIQNVFEGLTDDEYDRTEIRELGAVVFQIFTYAISEMFAFSNSKN